MGNLVAVTTLVFKQGNDLLLEFTVTRDGVVVNINGMTPHFAMAPEAGDTPLVQDPSTASAAISDGINGKFQVGISKDVTVDLLGTYEWEATLNDLNGKHVTVARGFVTFVRKVV